MKSAVWTLTLSLGNAGLNVNALQMNSLLTARVTTPRPERNSPGVKQKGHWLDRCYWRRVSSRFESADFAQGSCFCLFVLRTQQHFLIIMQRLFQFIFFHNVDCTTRNGAYTGGKISTELESNGSKPHFVTKFGAFSLSSNLPDAKFHEPTVQRKSSNIDVPMATCHVTWRRKL